MRVQKNGSSVRTTFQIRGLRPRARPFVIVPSTRHNVIRTVPVQRSAARARYQAELVALMSQQNTTHSNHNRMRGQKERERQINATELNLSRRIGGQRCPLTPERSGVGVGAIDCSTVCTLTPASFWSKTSEMGEFRCNPAERLNVVPDASARI